MHPFTASLHQWYAQNSRQLPWRATTDPYRIWVSEVILQQTTVAQGTDYYLRFVRRFPTVQALAAAKEEEVLALWQGLGYYSRARHMHQAAQSIGDRDFPNTYAEVRALKGVGDYTAAAICSIAFALPHAAIDGNVYRVLARYFGIHTPIDSTEGKKYFAALATQLLDAERPGLHNQALMDFGALQCTPRAPLCRECPLRESCAALEEGSVAQLPVKTKRTAVRVRHFVYVAATDDEDALYLQRRKSGDIWQGLYEPLLFEFNHAPQAAEVIERIRKEYGDTLAQLTCVKTGVKHVLTHQRIMADFWKAQVMPTFPRQNFRRVTPCELSTIPLPQLVLKFIIKNLDNHK